MAKMLPTRVDENYINTEYIEKVGRRINAVCYGKGVGQYFGYVVKTDNGGAIIYVPAVDASTITSTLEAK